MFVPIFHQHRHVRLDIHIGLSVCTICWSTHVRHPCLMVQPNFFVMVRPTFLKFKTQLWHTFTGWWCNNHLEKYEILKNNGVHQWEGSHPIYEMENKHMFQTTNQLTYFRYISMARFAPGLLIIAQWNPPIRFGRCTWRLTERDAPPWPGLVLVNVDFPHSKWWIFPLFFVCLPEGKPPFSYGFPMVNGYTTIIPVYQRVNQLQTGL